VKRFGDQTLAYFGAVGVGGVDQRDSELHGPMQYRDGGCVIRRLAPYALPRDSHGSEAQAMHRQIPA
jgi:hypothetical protein